MFNWKFGSKPADTDDQGTSNQEAEQSAARAPQGAHDGNPGAGPGNMQHQRGNRGNQQS